MARKLTRKQKQWADNFIDGQNQTEAALNSYDTTSYQTAGLIGSDNIKKPKIVEYIESQAPEAMARIVKLSIEARNETVKLNANKDIVDRAGFKPPEVNRNALNFGVVINLPSNTEYKEIKQ